MTGIDRVPATLTRTLFARGFTTLTPVQTAILDAPEADLLVSARTGSGKTLALGLALAREVLDADGLYASGPEPRALILVPTRELAAQVRNELAWLFAGTGARIASCVGGADVAAERAALARGCALVVGTPGRVADHIRRGALPTDALATVALDEADDMLDLGFREELEAILTTLPSERRTLMFSATITPRIEALAARFQTGAARIDIAAPEGEASIAFQGMLVAPDDRDKAVINLLCLHEPESALVFCGRRESVALLTGELSARGFRVVALSGDLGQSDRDAALAAMRSGRAKVCVATDVAARGLDLPGLDLVIHADLPANREILLHRSGRTGRAGRKGLAVLVVPPASQRRAETLIARAGLALEWHPVPRREEIEAGRRVRMLDHVAPAAETEQDREAVSALLSTHGPEQVAAAFVQLWRAGRPAPEDLAGRAAAGARSRTGGVWFSVNLGHGGQAEVRWILPLLCRLGRVSRRDIGRVRVRDGQTQFEVRGGAARGFANAAARHGDGGPRIERLGARPGDAPEEG